MLKKHLVSIFVFIVFVVLSVGLFRKYVFTGYIPFPSNLLVSFYSPWKFEKWEGYPNGPANKPIGFDNLKLFYPYRTYSTERLKAGELPLWNPYVFSGNIHLATYQSAIFYPLNVLYLFIPTIDAWSILVIIQPILAGYFTYLFLRSLGLSFRSAFFGSVVFAFSGWMIAWSEESLVIEHSALWLPLVLYGIQQLFSKRITLGFFLVVIGLACSILAGFLQMTLYVGLFSLGFIIFRYLNENRKNTSALLYFIFACIGSVLISAVHLLPSFVSYFYSPRGVVSTPFIFDIYLMKPWHLITLLAPDFWGNPGSYNYFGGPGFFHEKVLFIGLPALLLAVYMFFQHEAKISPSNFFRWASLITLLLGFFPVGWLLYYIKLPIISAMVPSRIFFLSTFSFSVMSGFGIEMLLSRKWVWNLQRKILFSFGLIIIFLWIFVLSMKLVPFLSAFDPKGNYGNVSYRNLYIPAMIFIFCTILFYIYNKWKNKVSILYSLFLTIELISLFYFAHKILYFSERKFVFPDSSVLSAAKSLAGVNRVWGYGNAHLENNMASYYGIYSPDGYDALYAQRYGELLYIQETKGQYTNQISRTDAQIRPAGENDKIYEDPLRSRLLSLVGVRYILESKKGDGKELLTTEERFPLKQFSLAWQDDNFRIWDYHEALPRAFLASDYIVENEPKKVISILLDPKFNPRQTLVLETKPVLNPCDTKDEGQVTIESYQPERVRIKTANKCDSLLFLSDTYYPGWIGTVDSKEVPILRADYAFRSVLVPAGEHLVEFNYSPREVQWGVYISILAIVTCYPTFLLLRRYV